MADSTTTPDPPPTDLTNWIWDDVVLQVFGMGKDGAGTTMDRDSFAGPNVHWVQFVRSTDETWDTTSGTRGPNYSGDGMNYDHRDSDDISFFILKTYMERGDVMQHQVTVDAKVTFWTAPDNGKSPGQSYQTYYDASDSTMSSLFRNGDANYDPLSFGTVAHMTGAAEVYLQKTETALKTIMDQIGDDDSALQGTAAGVVAAAIKSLYQDVHLLHRDLAAHGQTKSWTDQFYEVENQMWAFRNKVDTAYHLFRDHTQTWYNNSNPASLIKALKDTLASVAIGDVKSVNISLPDNGNGHVSGTVDITTQAGWDQINTMVKQSWLNEAHALDVAVQGLLTTLADSLNTTAANIRWFSTPANTTTTTTTGNSNTNIGGGGTGDLGGGDLSGGDIGGGDVGGGDVGGGDIGSSDIGGGDIGSSDLSGGDLGSSIGGGIGSTDLGSGSGSSGLGDLGSGDLGSGDLGSGDLGSGSGSSGLGDLGGTGIGDIGDIGTGTGSSGLGDLGSSSGGSGLGGLAGGLASGLGSLAGGGLSGLSGGSSARTATSSFPTDVDGVDVGTLGGGAGSGVASNGTTTSGVALGDDVAAMLGEDPVQKFTGTTGSGTSSSGYPYMPGMGGGMGGMGGNQQGGGDKDRERKTWLEEDEDVWGTEPEVTAAVIGRGHEQDEQPATAPSLPGRPGITRQTPAQTPYRRRA